MVDTIIGLPCPLCFPISNIKIHFDPLSPSPHHIKVTKQASHRKPLISSWLKKVHRPDAVEVDPILNKLA